MRVEVAEQLTVRAAQLGVEAPESVMVQLAFMLTTPELDVIVDPDVVRVPVP